MSRGILMSKFYITTSIPYATAPPHLGHILDPLIADVLARYHRRRGEEVRFLVGTDEHGAKVVRAAESLGKGPKELVDAISGEYRKMHNSLNISWDDFIRTSDQKRHWPGAQKIWQALKDSGDIYWKKYRGLYCVGHEAFITEKDLVDGKCEDHQKEPEVIEEENWFFRLSKYSKEIEAAITSESFRVLPLSRRNEILAFIRSGLEDISISRPKKDIPWGVPVPDDDTQTMYVWFEALCSYISSIGYGREDAEALVSFQKWWPADVQVVGKDNLRFHAAIWPGMLLSAGLALPKTLFVHGFVTVDGKKISKTVGNVIPPQEVINRYGIDAVRYYFLREFPSHEDGDFSYKKFETRYNGELANGLGNLVARVAAIGEKLSPLKCSVGENIEVPLKNETERILSAYQKTFEEIRLKEALDLIWELISFTDKYLNTKRPWELEGEALRQVIVNAGYLIVVITDLLDPFLPETSDKIREQINFEDGMIEIKKSAGLFPRL